MASIRPQIIKDTAGKEMVILSKEQFDALIEELEDLDDVRLYDEAKREDDGERIPFEEAFKMIEEKRNKDNE